MISVICGNWGGEVRTSVIAGKIASALGANCVFNGGEIRDLPKEVSGELVVWMPNIENDVAKNYPKKAIGTTLIVSKVIRGEKPLEEEVGNAIKHIFDMKANAVICITKVEKRFYFALYDALGNIYCDTPTIDGLVDAINNFHSISKSQVRFPTYSALNNKYMDKFVDIIHRLQDRVESSCGIRYFGNASTRCSLMFPSFRINNEMILVSKRNIDKTRITSNDFTPVILAPDSLINFGLDKPSVDSATQCLIYTAFQNINYMIHGHAYISGGDVTGVYFADTVEYYPCGDSREFSSIARTVTDYMADGYAINLKGHGFILMARTLETIEVMVEKIKFNQNYITLPFNGM